MQQMRSKPSSWSGGLRETVLNETSLRQAHPAGDSCPRECCFSAVLIVSSSVKLLRGSDRKRCSLHAIRTPESGLFSPTYRLPCNRLLKRKHDNGGQSGSGNCVRVPCDGCAGRDSIHVGG